MSKALSLPRNTSPTLSSSQSSGSLQPGRLRLSGAALLSRSLFSLRRPVRARQLSASVSDLARRVIDLRSADDPPQVTGDGDPAKVTETAAEQGDKPSSGDRDCAETDPEAFDRSNQWHQKVYRSLKPKAVIRGRSPARGLSKGAARPPTCFLCSGSTANTGFIIVHGHYLHINCLRCARCQILLEVGDCQIR
ncbi:uncharacterized protein LOC122381734 [Amphibalanus amphitrite]|uniref:uncharacterized protein LOC122381734 n=1 Tax=Amphibalanus amphitrite TaxID=1232801 RepID=UPI001C919124|nr:uncharacterized protein LOC122381734 [Amphibalanus amphitrite]